MSRVSLIGVTLTPIEHPRCGKCQNRMMLARITALPDGSEERTFECPRCNFTETTTVVDPLKSEAIERLTINVQPPA